MNESGGYDFEVVEKLVKEYECPVCLLLIKDAMELPCSHAICKTCLHKWELFGSSYQCPSCKGSYKRNQARPSRIVDRVIRTSLDVKCKEKKKGCEWIGKISDYEDHEKKCQYKLIECENAACCVTVVRNALAEHKLACLYRLVKCEFCGTEEIFNNLKDHFEVCCSHPEQCPNDGCMETIERKLVSTHVETDCLFKELECEFKSVGCEIKVLRKNVQNHAQTFLQQHLTMLLKHSKDNQELLETKKKLSEAEKKLSETEKKLSTTKEKLENTERKVNELVENQKNTEERVDSLETRLSDANEKVEEMWIHLKESNNTDISADKEQNKKSVLESITNEEASFREDILKLSHKDRYNKLFDEIKTCRLYQIDLGRYYLKLNVDEYDAKKLSVQMHTVERREMYKSHKHTVHYNKNFCLRKYKSNKLNLFVFLDGWNYSNTTVFIMHPQYKAMGERSYPFVFQNELTKEYINNDHVLIGIERNK